MKVHEQITLTHFLKITDTLPKLGIPGGVGDKEPACQCILDIRDILGIRFDPWVRKIP